MAEISVARKTKSCRFFGTPSGCRFGNDCRFFHQIIQSGKATHTGDNIGEATCERNEYRGLEQRNEGDTSAEVARTSSEADSPRAKDDNNRKHCRYFQRNGGCARGDNCHFAHVKSAAERLKGRRLPRVKSKLRETSKDISEKTIKKLVRQPDAEGVQRQQPVENAPLQPLVSNVFIRSCKETTSSHHIQPLESTNQQSENVHPNSDKPLSRRTTPFDKDGIRSEAATDNSLAECSKLRSTEIQQLKRRFGGLHGYFEELLENVKFKVKFKPTDPDWPFKMDAVYLTIWFPEDYPKEIFKVFLSEEQGLPQEIVKYANRRIMQWTKNQHHTGMAQGVYKLYFRPFLRWFDRNLESFFIVGGRQTSKDFKTSMAGTSRKISPQTRSHLKTDIADTPIKVEPHNIPLESCSSVDTTIIDVSKWDIKLVEDNKKDTAPDNRSIASQQTELGTHVADTASVTPLEGCIAPNQDIGRNMESKKTQDLHDVTAGKITHNKQDKDDNDGSKSLCSGTSVTTMDSNIAVQKLANAGESVTSLTSETLSIMLKKTVGNSQDSRMHETLSHNRTVAPLKNGEQDTDQSSSSVKEVDIFDGSMQPDQAGTSDNQSDKVPSDNNLSANAIKRGTEIQFKRLDLDENTSTIRAIKLSLTLECARCHQRNDEQLSGLGPSNKQCPRCYSVLSVAYNPAVIHQFCSVVGFLDLNGCVPFDVVLPESEFMLGCLQCSKETSIKGLQYGANKSWCRHCHQKLGFAIQSTRFQGVATHLETAVSLKKSAVPSAGSKPKKPSQNLGIKEGQPLPGNGTCKHYKKSYRWLRFPCCGKCYPCDFCHEENEAHEMKFATRMVCGFCSTEQPYSQHPCTACKAAVTKTHSAHWEGGRGCRDKIHMSRNDDQKYKQLGKTISRKAQKQSQHKGKGKGRK